VKRIRKPTPEFLLIDMGNTRLKWATAGKKWPIRIAGDVPTSKVTGAWVRTLAKKYRGHCAVMACVVPKLLPAFRRTFGQRLLEVSSMMPDGFHMDFGFRYPKPSELGSDRIAAIVAAHGWGMHPAIVVACGTATAFTVLDAKGRLCGGAIAPGLQAQLKALLGATAQLPATDLHMPNTALAKSTRDAIRAGVMLNYRGGVKEILAGLLKTLAARPKPNIILTGGDAHLLVNELGHRVKLRPLLVFEGLRMIGLRTRTKMS
jgi:type III pantothenate kinase